MEAFTCNKWVKLTKSADVWLTTMKTVRACGAQSNSVKHLKSTYSVIFYTLNKAEILSGEKTSLLYWLYVGGAGGVY